MRQWQSDGKLASGGLVYTYQSGTLTPKTTYQDAALTIPNTNPVVLSASGSANIFLADGAYRLHIKDQYGQQIEPWLDGVVGGGSGGGGEGSNSSFVTVKIYEDLRALGTVPDTVYVTGKIAEGDGGAGWFQRIPGSTVIDDDGVILTSASGSNVYKRVFDGVIDAQWYGVRYGISADQTVFLNHALTGSVTHNYPVQITGSVYINQNVTVPTKAALIATDDGFFTASLAVNMTFADDSKLTCTSRTFGSNVSPKIGKRVIDRLKLSYMGGSVADDRMDKLLLASTLQDQIIEIDESVSILASTWVCPNILEFTNNAYLIFTGASGLVWTSKYIKPEANKMFQVDSTASVAFDFGNQFAYAEMLGAVADGATDDSVALSRVANTGYLQLAEGKTYYSSGFVTFDNTIIRGNATIAFGPSATGGFSGTQLELQEVTITKSGSSAWCAVTTLTATNSALPSTNYTATNKSITGCSYATDTRYPVLDGTVGPSANNLHLPNIVNAFSLYTDINGKINKGSRRIGYDWSVINFAGNTQYYNSIRYFNGNWIIVGNNGLIKTSTDMVNWTIRNSGTSVFLSDVTWNGTYYVVVGDSSTYLRSSDLVTWTPATTKPTTTGTLVFVCTNGSRFVTCDQYNGQVVSSTDGLNWTNVQSLPGGSGAGALAFYKNGYFICGGNRGYISISTDGVTFVGVNVPNGPQFYCADYDGKNIVLISAGTSVLFPNISNGTYTSYPTGQTETIYNMKYIDGTFVAVGANGRIMTSRDGKYWTNRYSGTSSFLYGLESNGFDIYATGASEIIMKEDYR